MDVNRGTAVLSRTPQRGVRVFSSSDKTTEAPEYIEKAQTGDSAAFGTIFRLYRDIVFGYAFSRTGVRVVAEDITSDTFLRAFRRIGSFTWQGRDISAWLVTIARNLISDHFKSGRVRFEVTVACCASVSDDDDDPFGIGKPDLSRYADPEGRAIDHLLSREVFEAIQGLTLLQQECVILRHVCDFSTSETAAMLGMREGAVKSMLLRAVATLARELSHLKP